MCHYLQELGHDTASCYTSKGNLLSKLQCSEVWIQCLCNVCITDGVIMECTLPYIILPWMVLRSWIPLTVVLTDPTPDIHSEPLSCQLFGQLN